ncbi:MAG: 50S ribosomal protein L29 [bacterium]
MKIEELRDLSREDLYQRLKELKAELFSLRIQAAQGRTANPAQIRKVKKTIARIKTLLSVK